MLFSGLLLTWFVLLCHINSTCHSFWLPFWLRPSCKMFYAALQTIKFRWGLSFPSLLTTHSRESYPALRSFALSTSTLFHLTRTCDQAPCPRGTASDVPSGLVPPFPMESLLQTAGSRNQGKKAGSEGDTIAKKVKPCVCISALPEFGTDNASHQPRQRKAWMPVIRQITREMMNLAFQHEA